MKTSHNFCPVCGGELKDGYYRCYTCGMKDAKPQRNEDFCPVCGERINPGWSIAMCGHCGREMCTEFCIPGGVGTKCSYCEQVEEEGEEV